MKNVNDSFETQRLIPVSKENFQQVELCNRKRKWQQHHRLEPIDKLDKTVDEKRISSFTYI